MLLLLFLLLLSVNSSVHQLVPFSGVASTNPKWWTKVHSGDAEDCWASSDCPLGRCCIRPMGSRTSICAGLRQSGESCRMRPIFAIGVPPRRKVYSSVCPCAQGLFCQQLGMGWVHSECVNPLSLKSISEALRLRRSFRRTILDAVLNNKHKSSYK